MAERHNGEVDLTAHLLAVVAPFICDKPPLQFFCTSNTLQRYLRARNNNVDKAGKLLLETLTWRHQERMHEVSWDEISECASTGKVFRVLPLSVDGRPVLHMRPRHENMVLDQASNVRHFAYQMEMATRLADRVSPDGKILTIIDYTDFSTKKNPPLSTSRKVLHILQCHYPERLHEAVLWHPPRIFAMLFKMVSPFVDPVTKKKMVMLEKSSATAAGQLAARVDVSQLDRCLGGSVEDTYDLQAYGAMMRREEAEYRDALAAFVKEMELIRAGQVSRAAPDGYLPMPFARGAPEGARPVSLPVQTPDDVLVGKYADLRVAGAGGTAQSLPHGASAGDVVDEAAHAAEVAELETALTQ